MTRYARLANRLGVALLVSSFIAAFLLLAGVASAQSPRRSFATDVSYQQCTESWAFACGQRTPDGQTFGTAHRMEHCTRYSFAPNGTFTVSEPLGLDSTHGRYRIARGVVRMTVVDDSGAVVQRFELPLSADGSTLGDLHRVQQ
jgi:hypothetical protein